MKHCINPFVDFVFKCLLGTEQNLNLLLDFLNNILKPAHPIESIQLLNPFNERQFSTDKLSIVDIKARDNQGIAYQIEVQVATPNYLKSRMLFTWGGVHSSQLKKGDPFSDIKSTIAIWLIPGTLDKDKDHFHHHYEAVDRTDGKLFNHEFNLHTIELGKWQPPDRLHPAEHWLYFFKEAAHWTRLPNVLKPNPIMRQAMQTLETISEEEQAYHLYQSRLNYERVQITDAAEMERLKREKEQAEKQAEQAQQEIQELKALLRQQGIER